MKLGARNLTVRGGGCTIVRDATLSVESGEIVCLVGPNGAGKSTLLRALAGVLPFSGEVELDAKSLHKTPARIRARQLAYLPQERRVEWAMPVRDVVALGRHPFQRRFARLDATDREAVDEAMRLVGIEELAERPATVLSGGELARTLLARALATGASLLLADEPASALDPFHQLQVMDILRARAQSTGLGVLTVMHDLAMASRYADRIVVMHRGEIVATGLPEDVLDEALLAQVFRIRARVGGDGHLGGTWEPLV